MLGYCFVFWCTCYYLALIAMDTVSQVKLDCKTVGFSQNRFNFQGLKHQHLRVCKPHTPSLQTFSWLLAHSFFFKFKISWGEVDALSWCFFVFLVQCGVILYINRILVFFHVYHVWLSNFYAIRHVVATNIVSCLWCGRKILNI